MIALQLLPYDESKVHAPDWVILVSGGLFVFGGLAMVFRTHQLAVAVLGNLMVVSFASVAAWIAVLGPAEHFSGGIPFVSAALNVKLARIIFGACAIMCLLMLIPGLKHLVKLSRSD